MSDDFKRVRDSIAAAAERPRNAAERAGDAALQKELQPMHDRDDAEFLAAMELATKTFLFNSDILFSDERHRVLAGEVPDGAKVVPLTLRCIHVMAAGNRNFMSADTWRFQVEGHGDNWYRTHYSWALIEDTPDNIAKAKEFHAIHAERARLQKKAVEVHNTIVTVKPPKVKHEQ